METGHDEVPRGNFRHRPRRWRSQLVLAGPDSVEIDTRTLFRWGTAPLIGCNDVPQALQVVST